MFNIGGGEFLVIALIALIVLGPQRLPDAARQVGKTMGELRRLSAGFQSELKDAFNDADTTATPTARRDVLSGPSDRSPGVSEAVSAVSGHPPARRAPLRAAPVSKAPPRKAAPAAGGTNGKKPAAKRSPAKAAGPVSKAARPRSKGS